MELGGYLLWTSWPRVKVLIDGRAQQVYAPDFYLGCLLAERDPARFAAMREEDGATWTLSVNRPGELHHAFLADDPALAAFLSLLGGTKQVELDAALARVRALGNDSPETDALLRSLQPSASGRGDDGPLPRQSK